MVTMVLKTTKQHQITQLLDTRGNNHVCSTVDDNKLTAGQNIRELRFANIEQFH